ncbi:YibE/F family protein [Corynebacterium simulans]|uniref:YibE/F family protein n=1 Tax=Corynebacterium simulans TaxID=146827 RepID=UPI001EF1F787|nr:YibE/F family protein [Corynebacterium simulans]MCG7248079.1 YibE/F family protein [Corynebacterium simulans]
MGKHTTASKPVVSFPSGGRLYLATNQNPWRLALLIGLALAVLVTIIGAIFLRPTTSPVDHTSAEFSQTYALNHPQAEGTVKTVDHAICQSDQTGKAFDKPPLIPAEPGGDCTRSLIDITSGDNAGKMTQLVHFGVAGDPDLHEGDRILLSEATGPNGDVDYAFADYQRSGNLVLWAIIAAIVIIAFAAWHGLRSLIGLAISLAIVFFYLLPALVEGSSPLGLALVTSAAIIFIVVPLVHGFNWKSASALGGALIALLLAAFLASSTINSTSLQGLSSEDNLKLLLYMPGVSIVGVLLCGFIIGALGSLNDISIAQASTVRELNELNPEAGPADLFKSAMKVGRDHIASMVYTIVLTYTGASVPLLMLITAAQRPAGQILSSDLVATELLRSAVGAMALTLAVPITTLIAALTIPQREAGPEPDATNSALSVR